MKKLLSLILALCVVMTMCIGFAEDTTGITSTGTNYLCDERTTLTVCTYDGVSQAFPTIGNDLRFWQWLEEYTNVHIEWEVHPNSDYNTVKATKLAAGDIDTDIMNVGDVATAVQAGQSGLAAPLDIEWLPNIVNYTATENANVLTNNTAVDGNIYSVSGDVSPNMGHICYMYNTDWLEKLGKEVPTTLDEFYDLCVAMKEAGDLNGNGEDDEIILTGSGLSMINILGNSFGMTMYEDQRFFNVDEDGKVYCEYVSDEMKELYEFCAKLYAEGILDPGITKTSADEMSQKIAQDKVGIFIYYSAFAVTYGRLTTRGQEDAYACTYAIGEALEGPRGDKFYTMRISGGNDSCIVSAKSENVELAARWLDTLTCDPVVLRVRTCGWEGEQYTLDESGNVALIYAEDGSPWSISELGCGQIAMPHYQNYAQLMNSRLNIPWYVEQYGKLLENSGWVYPDVPLLSAYTEDEQMLLDMSKADCAAYFTEMRAKFITGEESLDNWDTYVNTLYGLGLQDYIDAEQSIYDRTR